MRYLLGVKMLGSDFKIRWKGDKSGQIVRRASIFLRFFLHCFCLIMIIWRFANDPRGIIILISTI